MFAFVKDRQSRLSHLSEDPQSLIQLFLHVFAKVRCSAFTRTLLALCLLLHVSGCGNPEEKYKQFMASADKYQKEQKWDEAKIQLQNAIDVKPKSAEAYFQLAEVLVRLQQNADVHARGVDRIIQGQVDGPAAVNLKKAGGGKMILKSVLCLIEKFAGKEPK